MGSARSSSAGRAHCSAAVGEARVPDPLPPLLSEGFRLWRGGGARDRPSSTAGVRASRLSIVAWRGRGGRGGTTTSGNSRADLPRSSCRSCGAKMSGENPASKPTPVQDVQGDGRWMSLVSDLARDAQESEVEMRGLRSSAGSRGST